jgi:hypothetical protein
MNYVPVKSNVNCQSQFGGIHSFGSVTQIAFVTTWKVEANVAISISFASTKG